MPPFLCVICSDLVSQEINVARKLREAEELRERTTRKPRAVREAVREEEETEALETVMHPSDHEDDDAEYYREALGEAPPTGRRIEAGGYLQGGRHTPVTEDITHLCFLNHRPTFAELGLDKPMTVRRGAQPKGFGRKRTSASEAPRPEAKRGKEGGSAGQGQEKKSAAKDRRGPNKRR